MKTYLDSLVLVVGTLCLVPQSVQPALTDVLPEGAVVAVVDGQPAVYDLDLDGRPGPEKLVFYYLPTSADEDRPDLFYRHGIAGITPDDGSPSLLFAYPLFLDGCNCIGPSGPRWMDPSDPSPFIVFACAGGTFANLVVFRMYQGAPRRVYRTWEDDGSVEIADLLGDGRKQIIVGHRFSPPNIYVADKDILTEDSPSYRSFFERYVQSYLSIERLSVDQAVYLMALYTRQGRPQEALQVGNDFLGVVTSSTTLMVGSRPFRSAISIDGAYKHAVRRIYQARGDAFASLGKRSLALVEYTRAIAGGIGNDADIGMHFNWLTEQERRALLADPVALNDFVSNRRSAFREDYQNNRLTDERFLAGAHEMLGDYWVSVMNIPRGLDEYKLALWIEKRTRAPSEHPPWSTSEEKIRKINRWFRDMVDETRSK